MRTTRNRSIPALIAVMTAGLLTLAGPATPSGASFPGANGRIAFSAIPVGELDREIYTANPNGSDVVRLTDDNANDTHPSWSPDGARIVYASDGDIFTMASNGTDVRLVTGASATESAPAYSPFGNRIVYVGRGSSDTELYTINLDGTNRFRLTRDKTEQRDPEWSPTGKLIAFEGTGPGNLDIFTIKPNGTNRRRLTDDFGNESGPTWNQKGTKVAYAFQEGGSPGEDIWRMKASGAGQTQVTADATKVDLTPKWSPDGKRILYLAALGGTRTIRWTSPNGASGGAIDVGLDTVGNPAWQRIPV